jgi:uncharacterized protein YeaO (DUF488 family)
MDMKLQRKRIYEQPEATDGKRILIDRVWPRGISKERAKLDEWMKDIAPSPEVRKWFCHDPNKFEEFKEVYRRELKEQPEKIQAVEKILNTLETENVTLLYAAKDEVHNHAIVLQQFLEEKLRD